MMLNESSNDDGDGGDGVRSFPAHSFPLSLPFLDPEPDSKDGGDDNNLSLPFSFFLSVRTTPAAAPAD